MRQGKKLSIRQMNKASLHKETFSSDPIKFTHFLMCTKNRIELILKNVNPTSARSHLAFKHWRRRFNFFTPIKLGSALPNFQNLME